MEGGSTTVDECLVITLSASLSFSNGVNGCRQLFRKRRKCWLNAILMGMCTTKSRIWTLKHIQQCELQFVLRSTTLGHGLALSAFEKWTASLQCVLQPFIRRGFTLIHLSLEYHCVTVQSLNNRVFGVWMPPFLFYFIFFFAAWGELLQTTVKGIFEINSWSSLDK